MFVIAFNFIKLIIYYGVLFNKVLFSWYHGRLARSNAEERLHDIGIPGCYLVRESERKAGSYVLSFLSEKSGPTHFRFVYWVIF